MNLTTNDVLKLAKAACPDVEWKQVNFTDSHCEAVGSWGEFFILDSAEKTFCAYDAAYDAVTALHINLEGLTAAYLEIKNEKAT